MSSPVLLVPLMGNLWSPSAAWRCSRSQSTKKMGRSSAGHKYKHWSAVNTKGRLSAAVSPTPDICLCASYCAGLLLAERRSSQRRSERLRRAQPAHGADCPSVLPGTVSTSQAAQGGRDGQAGAASHFWLPRGCTNAPTVCLASATNCS